MLQRVRQWRDLIPAVVLAPAMAPALSVVHLVLVAIAVAACSAVPQPFVGWSGPGHWLHWHPDLIGQQPLRFAVVLALWLLIGLLPAAMVIRDGALSAIDRRDTFLGDLRRVASRFIPIVVIFLLHVLALAACWVAIFACGLPGRLPGVIGDYGSEIGGLLAVLLTTVAGYWLLAAAPTAILAVAAVLLEHRGDALDALSRGAEYVLRRTLLLLAYAALSGLLAGLVGCLAWLLSTLGMTLGSHALRIASGRPEPPLALTTLLTALPYAVAATAWLSQWGAIYLLLRQSANGQEIEDIFADHSDRQSADLPSLKPGDR